LIERYAKHRSDEAQTPSPQVCAQLFVPHGDERKSFCSATIIFWMDVLMRRRLLHNICFSFSLLFRRESTTTTARKKKTTTTTTTTQ
jgi:hypothetical protein